MLRVHVGGADFYGAPPTGDVSTFEGASIQPGGLTGWWGRPGGRGGGDERLGQHGEYDEPVLLGGRVVTIAGHVFAPEHELDVACERLSGLGADGGRLRLVVDRGGRSTWSWCRVLGVQVDVERLTRRPPYMVTLRCANPRRFGEVRRQSVRANVPVLMENRGNFEAAPRFIVSGPHPSGYSIVAAGQPTFSVPHGLPAGSTDVVDFATATVRRNGVELLGATADPRVWTVPAAGVQQWQSAPTGSGAVVGEVTDTYM